MNNINEILNGNYQEKFIQVFGITHFKYPDCSANNLIEVPKDLYSPQANDGILIHSDCLNAFIKMSDAAKLDNICLTIESAYRSSEYQIEVFKRKLDDPNSPSESSFAKRLEVSAPAGYSEHHTGLAIDINSTEDDFAFTKEFTWLNQHAINFGFEMSFPQYNKQNIAFEPWHWRFVGTVNAHAVFRNAQNFNKN